MKRICSMPPDINTCPYYIPSNISSTLPNAPEGLCSNPSDNCGMLKLDDDKIKSEPYKRAERWYEKYYKK